MSYLGNGFGLYSVVSIIDENDIVIMSTFLSEKLKKIGRSCGGGDGGVCPNRDGCGRRGKRRLDKG